MAYRGYHIVQVFPVVQAAVRHAVYMVEDDPDVAVLARALCSGDVDLQIVTTAEQALDELFDGPVPELIVLDIDLPGQDGLTVLQALRGHPRTRHVPVVVFTATEVPAEHGYALGANAWVQKPSDAEALEAAMEGIMSFWCRWNEPGQRQVQKATLV